MKLKVIYKDGIPFAIYNEKEYQFELEKDEVEKMALEYASLPYKNWPKDAQIILLEDNARLDFIAGYKAAQEKGCYSIEDMRKAISDTFRIVFKNSLLIQEDSKRIEYDIINSLNQPKKLVAIEVETLVIAGKGKGERNTNILNINKSEEYPDGILTIKQYYYEMY